VSNPSKARGTAAETAVVGYFRRRGWIHAERRTLSGAHDKGDLAGVVGVCAEIKACKAMDLAGWMRELGVEQANAKATVGAVIAKKRGTTNPAEWYAVLTLRQFCDLLAAAGYRDSNHNHLDEEAS
jgi:hypothetical protein